MDTNKQIAPRDHGGAWAGCDLTGAAPLTEHVRALRAALVRALATPATVEQIGARVGIGAAAVLPHLLQLAAEGCLVRHDPHGFAVAREAGAPGYSRRLPPRPQPVRDAIFAYLSEPRQAKEVAAHIGRPVPNATGHLAAMLRLGLVVRTGYGRYERADLVADGACPAVIIRPHPVRDATLGCLKGPMHCNAVAALTGRTPSQALHALRHLVTHGLAVHLGRGVYAPAPKPDRPVVDMECSVRAFAGDAVAVNGKDVPCSP